MATERTFTLPDGSVVHLDVVSQTIMLPSGMVVNADIQAAAGGATITPPAGTLTYTGQAPTITVTAGVSIEIPAGSLSYTGQVPTVSFASNQVVATQSGTLTYLGLAPTVRASDTISVEAQTGALTYTGQVPTVAVGSSFATTITVSGITEGTNLSSLSYVVFDGADVGTASVIAQGNDEETNASGDLTIDLTSLNVVKGTTLTIVITNYTSTPSLSDRGAVCFADAA